MRNKKLTQFELVSMNNQLLEILTKIYYFAPGLKKSIFHWDKLPDSVVPLAGTDSSGLVKYRGSEWYVTYDWPTNKIQVEK